MKFSACEIDQDTCENLAKSRVFLSVKARASVHHPDQKNEMVLLFLPCVSICEV